MWFLESTAIQTTLPRGEPTSRFLTWWILRGPSRRNRRKPETGSVRKTGGAAPWGLEAATRGIYSIM